MEKELPTLFDLMPLKLNILTELWKEEDDDFRCTSYAYYFINIIPFTGLMIDESLNKKMSNLLIQLSNSMVLNSCDDNLLLLNILQVLRVSTIFRHSRSRRIDFFDTEITEYDKDILLKHFTRYEFSCESPPWVTNSQNNRCVLSFLDTFMEITPWCLIRIRNWIHKKLP